MKKIYLTAFLLAGITFGCVLGLRQANAADLSQFQPGRIIDDAVFIDNQSMSAAQIQDFLVQKNSVCLKDFRSLSIHDDNGDGIVQDSSSEQYGPGTMSAAELIAEAAKIYRINPKVLLVTLQKEQGLITRADCPDWRYNTALGYGCPDTAPCDQSAFGFTRQIDYGSYHFRGYYDDSLPSVPYGTGNQTIYFNPNASCGSSVVNIQNRATASLYNYTPYQPNAASLAAGYGTAEPCGAYGNRNFYQYFTDWFGSPLAPNYSWQLQHQYVYSDATKTQPASLDNLMPGQRAYVGFTATNTGSTTWTNSGSNPIYLGASRPYERLSRVYDPSWPSTSRPALLKESSVAPGEVGTFEFWIKAPTSTSATDLQEYFTPLAEGKAWMPDIGLFYKGNVQPARYTWSMVSQYAYTDESKTAAINMNNLLPGQRVYAGVVAKNTGNMIWQSSGPNALMLGNVGPHERKSNFANGSNWLTATRPTLLREASVAPEQNGTFEFWLTIPQTGSVGIFNERFNLIANNFTWLNDVGLSYYMNVQPARYTWSMVSQYAYTDESKTTVVDMNDLRPGQQILAGFTAKNTGNMTWQSSGPNAVMTGTASPYERASKFSSTSSWLTGTRPVLLKEPSVAPGGIGTFEFKITIPMNETAGIHNERFNIIANNLTWMNDVGLSYYMNIR